MGLEVVSQEIGHLGLDPAMDRGAIDPCGVLAVGGRFLHERGRAGIDKN